MQGMPLVVLRRHMARVLPRIPFAWLVLLGRRVCFVVVLLLVITYCTAGWGATTEVYWMLRPSAYDVQHRPTC